MWLHAQLANFLRRGARAVSMEASSIGLDQDRVAGVEFDAALFTNLTRDHLDYHRTMQRYRRAKQKLFECESLTHAIVNLDDEYGRELAQRVRRRGLNVLGYGFAPHVPLARRVPRVIGANFAAGSRGMRFEVRTPWGRATIESPLIGRHNASNLLGSLATSARQRYPAEGCGGNTRPAETGAGPHAENRRRQPAAGGCRLCPLARRARAGVAQPARTRRRRTDARIICVFGCGGERDRGKRPLMGALATRLADHVVITSDNPRGEHPLAIIADIRQGARGDYTIEPDRRRAIARALRVARRGDIVLVAGKGHETYQEVERCQATIQRRGGGARGLAQRRTHDARLAGRTRRWARATRALMRSSRR